MRICAIIATERLASCSLLNFRKALRNVGANSIFLLIIPTPPGIGLLRFFGSRGGLSAAGSRYRGSCVPSMTIGSRAIWRSSVNDWQQFRPVSRMDDVSCSARLRLAGPGALCTRKRWPESLAALLGLCRLRCSQECLPTGACCELAAPAHTGASDDRERRSDAPMIASTDLSPGGSRRVTARRSRRCLPVMRLNRQSSTPHSRSPGSRCSRQSAGRPQQEGW